MNIYPTLEQAKQAEADGIQGARVQTTCSACGLGITASIQDMESGKPIEHSESLHQFDDAVNGWPQSCGYCKHSPCICDGHGR